MPFRGHAEQFGSRLEQKTCSNAAGGKTTYALPENRRQGKCRLSTLQRRTFPSVIIW